MELIYLWMAQDEHGCFRNAEFNFSPCYHGQYDPESKTLKIEKTGAFNVFKEHPVENVTAIIGENGTGKTTLMQYLTVLNDKHSSRKYLAVYCESGRETIKVRNHTGVSVTLISDTIPDAQKTCPSWGLQSGQEEIDPPSNIYLSNSAYLNTAKISERDNGMNFVVLADSTLSMFRDEFYKGLFGIAPERNHDFDDKSRFKRLQSYCAAGKNNNDFQAFLDTLYYFYLGQIGQEFLGKKIDRISLSVAEAGEDIPYDEVWVKQDEILAEGRRKAKEISRRMKIENFADVLVYNLIFELAAAYDNFNKMNLIRNGCPQWGMLDSREVFEQCEAFIGRQRDDEKRRYYERSVEEIKRFALILADGKVEGKFHCEQLEKERCCTEVDIRSLAPWMDHLRRKHSFVLKYLRFWNLSMSSGERALLNMMSRIYFSSRITNFLVEKSFSWKENVLLMIDEIDLYLHPEWQRQILNELLKAIKLQFPYKRFQIMITSHSPIVLSDVPKENSIFLQRDKKGKVRQVTRSIQTFGANIYTLYRDAFFLEGGLAMGEFARGKINQWIGEIEAGEMEPKEAEQKIAMIGEPVIAKKLQKMQSRRENDREQAGEDRRMDQTEREQMIRFLKQQKASIDRQLRLLGENDDD